MYFKIYTSCLIQKPKYASNCFAKVLNKHRPIFSTPEEVITAYKENIPTSRKVIKCLKPPNMNDHQRAIYGYLAQFLKTLEHNELCKFLRFVTATDNILTDGIFVVFTKQMPRAPRSRVCVPQLEIDDTYTQYNELAEELSSILSAEDSSIKQEVLVQAEGE